MDKIRKTWGIQLKEADAEAGRYSITITTPGVDRDFDRVLPGGADLSRYMANPVVMWAHDYSGWTASEGIPIGRTLSLDVSDAGINADFEFLPGDPFVDRVRNAWDRGFLRTASIGFMPTEWEANEQDGWDFTGWELLEWSLVPIPANPEALRLAMKSAGLEEFIARPKGKAEDITPPDIKPQESGDDAAALEALAEGMLTAISQLHAWSDRHALIGGKKDD